MDWPDRSMANGKVAIPSNATAHRSWTMSRVSSKHTRPEVLVRKAAHALGLRFRLHRADLPGTPDMVFPARTVALFVNGCFWHSHRNCKRARIPKSNTDYWIPKLLRNKRRDGKQAERLKRLGWRSVVIWECETRDPDKLTNALRQRVVNVKPQGRRSGSSN
jgi:DNA mismatch endonuclease (patch repair protein)